MFCKVRIMVKFINFEKLFSVFSIKFDGTNIAKDDDGTLYSRRFVLEEHTERFQQTSLQKVKEADIRLVRRLILKYCHIEANIISKGRGHSMILFYKMVEFIIESNSLMDELKKWSIIDMV